MQTDLQFCILDVDTVVQGEIEDDALLCGDTVKIDLIIRSNHQVIIGTLDRVPFKYGGLFSIGIKRTVAVFGIGAHAGTDRDTGMIDFRDACHGIQDQRAQLFDRSVLLGRKVSILQRAAGGVRQTEDRAVDAQTVKVEECRLSLPAGHALDFHKVLVNIKAVYTDNRHLINSVVICIVFTVCVVVVFENDRHTAHDIVLDISVLVLQYRAVFVALGLFDFNQEDCVIRCVGSADQLKACASEGKVCNNRSIDDLNHMGGIAALNDAAVFIGCVMTVLLAVVNALREICAAVAGFLNGNSILAARIFLMVIIDRREVVFVVDDTCGKNGSFEPHLNFVVNIQRTDCLAVRFTLCDADGSVEFIRTIHKFVRRIGEARTVVGGRKLTVLRLNRRGGACVEDNAVFVSIRVKAGRAVSLIAFVAEGRGSAGNIEIVVFRVCLAERCLQAIVKDDRIGGCIQYIGLQRNDDLRVCISNLDKSGVGADLVIIDVDDRSLPTAGHTDRTSGERRAAGGADGKRSEIIHGQAGDLAVKRVVRFRSRRENIIYKCFAGDIQLLRLPLIIHRVRRRIEL